MSVNWEDALQNVDIERVNAELAYLEKEERQETPSRRGWPFAFLAGCMVWGLIALAIFEWRR